MEEVWYRKENILEARMIGLGCEPFHLLAAIVQCYSLRQITVSGWFFIVGR